MMYIQPGHGVCPVCAGTCRVAVPAQKQSYKKVIQGYDADTDTIPCDNCGAQRQWGRATGEVRLNKSGEPCVHKYQSKNVGRCLTRYTCEHCGDSYQIDSGD